jgi:type II secretory pathway pseudopilin PulG
MEQNKTGKYLKYAIGEIILVVIGILIALSINNWNEGRKATVQETLYLNRLLSENKQDIVAFKDNIKELEKGIESVENFSKALKDDTTNDSTLIKSANEYFKYGSIYPIFYSSNSTFDDLSSTGNLKVITNTGLRDSIVQHYANHKFVAERIKIAISWALPLDAPFTHENDIMKFEPNTAFLFPDQPKGLRAKELREKKVTYISNAAAHYWINMDAIIHLEGLIAKTNNLIAKLENELNK